jgi:hypothetical protein
VEIRLFFRLRSGRFLTVHPRNLLGKQEPRSRRAADQRNKTAPIKLHLLPFRRSSNSIADRRASRQRLAAMRSGRSQLKVMSAGRDPAVAAVSPRKQSRAVEIRERQAVFGEMDPQHADADPSMA